MNLAFVSLSSEWKLWAAAQIGRIAQPRIAGKLPMSSIFIIEINNRIATDGTVENAHHHRAT
jgi:hypothetical protein